MQKSRNHKGFPLLKIQTKQKEVKKKKEMQLYVYHTAVGEVPRTKRRWQKRESGENRFHYFVCGDSKI